MNKNKAILWHLSHIDGKDNYLYAVKHCKMVAWLDNTLTNRLITFDDYKHVCDELSISGVDKDVFNESIKQARA